jgi:hypothetical protein
MIKALEIKLRIATFGPEGPVVGRNNHLAMNANSSLLFPHDDVHMRRQVSWIRIYAGLGIDKAALLYLASENEFDIIERSNSRGPDFIEGESLV